MKNNNFKRNEEYLSSKDADDEQSKFTNKFKNIDRLIKKKLFLGNIGRFFTVREIVVNNFKNRLFLIKNLKPKTEPGLESEPKPKYGKLSLKLWEYLNEIVNEEKNINEEICRNYCKYKSQSSLGKDLKQI